MIRFKVQGREHEAAEGESLLTALRRCGYRVPSLCHHEAVSPYGACRLCLVEVQRGRKRRLTTSCNCPVEDGLQVFLDTVPVVRHRRIVLQLLLAMAPAAAPVRQLAAEYGVTSTPYPRDEGNDCILCGLCTRVCSELVGVEAIAFSGRGTSRHVTTPYNVENDQCLACGACVEVCPTGRLRVIDDERRRRLPEWHRETELARCAKCGRVIAPVAALAHIAGRTNIPVEDLGYCVDCRADRKLRTSARAFATASRG
jgi:NADH dehydrogenase/NADH:ubiquinone oxidoreductase subunit G